MNLGKWQIGWQRSNYESGVSVALYLATPDGGRDVMNPDGTVHHVPPGEPITRPTLVLNQDQLQAFANGLWEMGARPKARRFDDEMKLLDNHLKDMRRLVFEVKKPADAQG